MTLHLVPADYVSDEDREMQRILDAHPALRYHLTLLINSYRSKIMLCVEEMIAQHIDTADILIAADKCDARMRRIGLPLLDDTEDWAAFRKERPE